MVMSTIALILFAALSINGDRQNAARQYAQKPRGQMGFKWTRQYARQGFGSSNYGNPTNTEQPQPQYPYGKGTSGVFGSAPSNTDEPATSSTENTETTTSAGSTEEPVPEPTSNTEEASASDEISNTITNTEEPETIMHCLNDKCAELFNACFNDEQCKEWMEEWQETKSLKPECLPSDDSYPSQETDSPSSDEPETEEIDENENAFETTEDRAFESTENTESTTSNTEYDESTSTSTTENTQSGSDENTENTENTESGSDESDEASWSYSSTETEYSSTDVTAEEEEAECEYNELFWNAYNCGVENYCYADQLKLAQSHQYLVQSPSNYRVQANVTGSKSSSKGSTLLIVALTSAMAALIIFEFFRRLYKAFQDKIQCQCSCLALNNSLRYIKNTLEQMRGYKYEKTHGDLDAIEESDDMGMYGTSSDKDESLTKDTTGVTYNGPLKDDSDISDDIELQKTDDDIMNNDDQFLHNADTVPIEEEKDTEEQEITVEAVQEPIQEL